MSTFTPALNLEQVARGGDVGTWDVPENSNWGLVDAAIGQIATISLNNANVVLSAAQFQSAEITFNSTLTGSVAITFPSTYTRGYAIQNLCTGSSAFTITLLTTVSSGQAILCPSGEIFDCWNDGTSIKFRNFGRIGEYWDYAGSSVPAWVSGCTVPPYLNCDGTSFSSATYPILSLILSGTTLPDLRGRYRAYLNQGTGRITAGSSTGGVDGNTVTASGGLQTTLLSSQNIPANALTDPGHLHAVHGPAPGYTSGGVTAVNPGGWSSAAANSFGNTDIATTGITIGSTSPTNFTNLPPTAIGGLTLLRAG